MGIRNAHTHTHKHANTIILDAPGGASAAVGIVIIISALQRNMHVLCVCVCVRALVLHTHRSLNSRHCIQTHNSPHSGDQTSARKPHYMVGYTVHTARPGERAHAAQVSQHTHTLAHALILVRMQSLQNNTVWWRCRRARVCVRVCEQSNARTKPVDVGRWSSRVVRAFC